ncbi:MAG: YebC/PmpR family DNA-binding transcriptional regulator [Oligoflexia bacterium]|nr:YebC/PmpR family DNA-binding transcriptional regulator [Oligoflexia bacterium]MBF0367665.1 YebC/PmpR family DNA-binding transcriptional regulator [Oligoflexia bacterium]
MGRKWANIKDKKASLDKQRGQVYTKLLKEITAVVKKSGGDPDANFLLRVALQKCRTCNVPKDNIERAIKKGLSNEGDHYEDVTYEGYGPAGVAIFIEASTNNVTRTVGNIRPFFRKYGGDIGKDGCLQFIFERKAVFELKQNGLNEDDFTLAMIDAGAEDVEFDAGDITVTASMENFGSLQKKFEELKITTDEASLERVPLSFKKINQEEFTQVMKLISVIEDDDDVLKVYHNIEYDPALQL